jgi:trimeric autotransporter adhesin
MTFRMVCVVVVLLLLALTLSPLTFAQTSSQSAYAVPRLVRFGGTAKDLNGNPLSGVVGVTFALYSEQSGGAPLWLETQNVTADNTGHYAVLLGSTKPEGLPVALFTSEQAHWVGVQVSGQPEQSRVLLVSAPYALKAGDAETIGGLPPSAFVLAAPKAGSTNSAISFAAVSPSDSSRTTSDVTTSGGTVNTLPLFTTASNVQSSIVTQTGSGTTGKVGINTTTPATTLDVNGSATVRGILTSAALGTATAAKGFNSQPQDFVASAFNSGTATAVPQKFQWQAEAVNNDTSTASGTMNLLYASGTATPAETGLKISSRGIFTFATGQTFPGTGSGTITGVTAGTALTGGGTTGIVTLNLDTTKVPLLSSANTFTGSQSLTSGDLSLGATSSANNGVINIGGVPFLHGFSAGKQNVFVGGAGNFTTTGTSNAATGFGALAAQSSGSHNTAAGVDALASVTTSDSNTGVGFSAGPTGAAFSNTTAIGANAKVGQSNSLVLGQTTAGSPGAIHVNVGIGTATPISTMEVAVSSAGAVGPILTLTNPGGDNTSTFTDGAAAIDFNTTAISTSGTYNPGARIEAVDDGVHSTDINFLSNIFGGGSGAANGGLQTNMTIFGLSGTVSIGTNEAQSQLEVIGTSEEGVWAFGGSEPDFGMTQGLNGLRAGGGPSTGTDTGGIGAWLFGGDVDDGGTGITGEGLLVWTGETESGTVGLAADFEGDVFVDGTLSANVKDFKIDHPLDPANKYLVHSSVESSEMMNIYSGNVTTDELGLATVALPDWFQAENTDFRYQLTVVDERFAQAVISKRIENNQFTIHTNASFVQVSWQITAVRQDVYAKAHPMVVEQVKGAKERGFYQHPELYGQPKEKQTQWGRNPAMVQKMVAEKRKLRDNALKNSRKISGNPQTRPSANTVNYSQLN